MRCFRYGNLLPEEREKIGIQCKSLLDLGRIDFLSEHGFTAKLIAYTDRANTLENIALTAVGSQNKNQLTVENIDSQTVQENS